MKNPLPALFAATAFLLTASSAHAQANDYPSRPIRLIVPYNAGGAVDIVGRVYAQKLSQMLGQTVVVENRPGGSAMIGIKGVLQAPADGYTLLMSTTTYTTNTIVYKAPGYGLDDFAVVAGLGVSGLLLLQSTTVPANNYAELIAYAKANPKKLNMGTLGGGGITQLLSSRFQHATGIQTTDIPYSGGSAVMQGLLGGVVDIFIDPMPTAIPQLGSNRIKALASTTDGRSPLAPEVPTFKELGVPSMIGGAWFAVHASAKTPQAIIDKLRLQSTEMMKAKDFLDKLTAVKVDPWTTGPESFSRYLNADKLLWEKDAERLGLKGTL
ncbi:MAG: tripartite tricarboxylate transporter substrate-binding protein [Pseudomonadota bacterium]